MSIIVTAKSPWQRGSERVLRLQVARLTVWLTTTGKRVVRPGHVRPTARPMATLEMTLVDGTYRSLRGSYVEAMTTYDADHPAIRVITLLSTSTLVGGPTPDHLAQTIDYQVRMGHPPTLVAPLESSHG